jgi:predicted Rossmann-fold nucleotide-binding protein
MLRFPVVLVGKEFHKDLYAHLTRLISEGTIAAKDIDLFLFTDSVDEAVKHIEENTLDRFQFRPRHKPKWWLFERKTAVR